MTHRAVLCWRLPSGSAARWCAAPGQLTPGRVPTKHESGAAVIRQGVHRHFIHPPGNSTRRGNHSTHTGAAAAAAAAAVKQYSSTAVHEEKHAHTPCKRITHTAHTLRTQHTHIVHTHYAHTVHTQRTRTHSAHTAHTQRTHSGHSHRIIVVSVRVCIVGLAKVTAQHTTLMQHKYTHIFQRTHPYHTSITQVSQTSSAHSAQQHRIYSRIHSAQQHRTHTGPVLTQ